MAEQHFRKPKTPAAAPSGGAATFKPAAADPVPGKPPIGSMSLLKTAALLPSTTLAAI